VVICVAEAEKLAEVPLKSTDVTWSRSEPVISTAAPIGPWCGLKDVITGGGVGTTVKVVLDVPVPSIFVTEIVPVVAPEGTVTVIWISESTLKTADVPLKETSDAPVKSVPEIVTLSPTIPEVGLKELTVGATANAGGAPTKMMPITTAANASLFI
jgi:hypothetical protein